MRLLLLPHSQLRLPVLQPRRRRRGRSLLLHAARRGRLCADSALLPARTDQHQTHPLPPVARAAHQTPRRRPPRRGLSPTLRALWPWQPRAAEGVTARSVGVTPVAEHTAVRAAGAVDTARRAQRLRQVHGDQLQQRHHRAVRGRRRGAGQRHGLQGGRGDAPGGRAGRRLLPPGVSRRLPTDLRGRAHESVGPPPAGGRSCARR